MLDASSNSKRSVGWRCLWTYFGSLVDLAAVVMFSVRSGELINLSFQKTSALVIVLSSVLFQVAAFSPISQIFVEPSAARKLEIITASAAHGRLHRCSSLWGRSWRSSAWLWLRFIISKLVPLQAQTKSSFAYLAHAALQPPVGSTWGDLAFTGDMTIVSDNIVINRDIAKRLDSQHMGHTQGFSHRRAPLWMTCLH